MSGREDDLSLERSNDSLSVSVAFQNTLKIVFAKGSLLETHARY